VVRKVSLPPPGMPVETSEFTLPMRYKMQKVVGRGSCGLVASCKDRSGVSVAIKKLKEPFGNERRATRVLRETKLLQLFSQHPNLLGLSDIFVSEQLDIYMVSPLMDTDLHRVICSEQPLSEQHVQWFMWQLLSGLAYMHACSVLHRDIKPSNILVNENCELRITDFGLSRAVDEEAEAPLTEYVVTRWYRAPELVLSCSNYTEAVDVWSAGLILAELINRQPLLPGDNQMDQLRRIVKLVGTQRLSAIPHTPACAERFMSSLPGCKPTPLGELCPTASENALELLGKLLAWEPPARGTAEDALQHRYLQPFAEYLVPVEPRQPAEPCFHSQHGEELDSRMQLLCEVLCSSEEALDEISTSLKSPARHARWTRGEEISPEAIRREAARRLNAFDLGVAAKGAAAAAAVGGRAERHRRQCEEATLKTRHSMRSALAAGA